MNFLSKINSSFLFEKKFFLNNQEINKIISIKSEDQESTIFLDNKKITSSFKNIRSSYTSWINFNEIPDIIYKINSLVDEINNTYWRFKINYLAEASIVSYINPKDNYGWHMDWNPTPSSCNRKISVLIQLSDPCNYEGCTLQIKVGKHVNYNFSTDLGSILIFPSFLLHRATKLISGKRQVLVLWYHGDSFV